MEINKAKANQACDHANDMVSKIAGAGDLVKAAAAKAMAQKLCDKVKGVVKMEINKANKMQKRIAKVQKAENTRVPGDADAVVPEHAIPEDAVVPEVDDKPVPAVAIGHMPAHVVKELEHDVASVRANEMANEKKAARLCAMAKKKIRNESGGASDVERKHSVEIAINFCHTNEEAVEKQEVD